MNRKNLSASLIAAMGLAAGAVALAQQPAETKPAGAPEFKLPPGWTQQDLQALIAAGTPGKMHEHLAAGVGAWSGKTTMWMVPDAEPMTSQCTSNVTSVMDGRYIKCEMTGSIPGMGPFTGWGIYGFDNVSQKFVATWIDNHNTGIMVGQGSLSADGKTLTWSYTYNCPITNKPAAIRDVETITGPNTKTLETFGVDPKSGKEFRMMRIEFTKK
jgi:hypothetical protein